MVVATVNAMAVKVPDFLFVDAFGGLGDLQRRRLRTPIDPHTSFGDDPLRMVRLARFAARLDAMRDLYREATPASVYRLGSAERSGSGNGEAQERTSQNLKVCTLLDLQCGLPNR